MSTSDTIQTTHLRRLAVVYVRQSSPHQALVNQEQVGIIFAYDVTRLARNCTDWYQLLDLCGFRTCLVGDQDGIYDPASPNGRLILGLKGLIAELELHTLQA